MTVARLAAVPLGLLVLIACSGQWSAAVPLPARTLALDQTEVHPIEMSIDAEEPIDCRELSLNARATWDGDPVPFSLHGDAGELQSGELDAGITWLDVPDWTQDGDLGCFAQIAVWLEPTVPADGTLQVTIEASEDVTSPADSRRDLVLRAEWMSEGIRRD